MPPQFAAVILAAGKSSRAAQFKPLRKWGSETFLEKVYRSLSQAGAFGEIIIVTGHQANSLDEPIRALGARSVFNKRFNTGMQSSIQKGLSSLESAWDAALIALVDQPQLETEDYRAIIQRFVEANGGLARPAFEGRTGNPAVISRKYLPEILAEPESDRGCAYLFSRYPDDARIVEMPNDRCLFDFDSDEDLAIYLKTHRG